MKTTRTAQQVLAANCQRLRADLSQADVVARAARHGFKIDQRTVSRLENPESANSTLKTIEAVAAALGVMPWQLLCLNPAVDVCGVENEKTKQIVEICRGLNEDGVTALLFQAEFCQATDKYKAVKSKLRKFLI